MILREKIKKNTIHKNDDGEWVLDYDELVKMTHDYFSGVYKRDNEQEVQSLVRFIQQAKSPV